MPRRRPTRGGFLRRSSKSSSAILGSWSLTNADVLRTVAPLMNAYCTATYIRPVSLAVQHGDAQKLSKQFTAPDREFEQGTPRGLAHRAHRRVPAMSICR